MIHVAMYAMAEKNRITAQKGFSTAKLEKALIGKDVFKEALHLLFRKLATY
jgi:hypothetical protein